MLELADWFAIIDPLDDNGPVSSLAVFDEGNGPALFAGGTFFQSDVQSLGPIARWTGSGWAMVGSGIGGPIETLEVLDDGSGPQLYAGGVVHVPTQSYSVSVGRVERLRVEHRRRIPHGRRPVLDFGERARVLRQPRRRRSDAVDRRQLRERRRDPVREHRRVDRLRTRSDDLRGRRVVFELSVRPTIWTFSLYSTRRQPPQPCE